jgi:hypothetical protein
VGSVKVCLKTIKGKQYLYTWQYRPMSERGKKRKYQRYDWKYVGRYNSQKSREFLSLLPINEQYMLELQYQEGVKKEKQLQKLKNLLENSEPYLHEKEEILKINNSKKRVSKLISAKIEENC